MNDFPPHSLKPSLKEMISVEGDIFKALSVQLENDEVRSHSLLTELLARAARESEARIDQLNPLCEEEGAAFGRAVKSGVTAVTGTFACLYGVIHAAPLSRLLRDNVVSPNFASIGYGVMLTLILHLSSTPRPRRSPLV